MLARPEVKRTYSRLKQPNEANEEAKTDPIDLLPKLLPKKKITDFFQVKRPEVELLELESDVGEAEPVVNVKLEDENASSCSLTSNPKSPIPSSPLTSVSNKLRQTFLDLGQKNLISSQCPDCLMHYNKSFPSDVALHKKFHAGYLKGFTFNCKGNYGEAVRELSPLDVFSTTKWSSRFRFYSIENFESAHLLKRLEFFLNFVHVQLGAEPLTVAELKKSVSAVMVVDGKDDRIIGIALFEPCERVYRSVPDCDGSSIELESAAEGPVTDFYLGVSRIWVDSKHRSRGFASNLLDWKCKGNRERIAFSQPTPIGFAFAKAYQRQQFDGKQCLIYLQ